MFGKRIQQGVVLLLIISLLGVGQKGLSARPLNLELDRPDMGTVIEVVDDILIRVLMHHTGPDNTETRLIRLIGLQSYGDQQSYDHVVSSLLGQNVFLLYDANHDLFPDITHLNIDHAYVYTGTGARSFNETQLHLGYALVDEAYHQATQYMDLVQASVHAAQYGVGYFEVDNHQQKLFNINTASFEVMARHLVDTSDEAIQGILQYRSHTPFTTVASVKYAHPELDYVWFSKNLGIYSVMTHVSGAHVHELASLFPNATNPMRLADQIQSYLVFQDLKRIEELKTITTIRPFVDNIASFIHVEPTQVYEPKNLKVVNLNTVGVDQLISDLSLSKTMAHQWITQRDKTGYHYKSVPEAFLYGGTFQSQDMTPFIKQATVATDINHASVYEMTSLFGVFDQLSQNERLQLAQKLIDGRPYATIRQARRHIFAYYNTIEPYIFVDVPTTKVTFNLNRASDATLKAMFDLSDVDLQKHRSAKAFGPYKKPSDIPFVTKGIRDDFSLFTDVNTASADELMSLNRFMTLGIVKDIMMFRAVEPITSPDELMWIFQKHERPYLLRLIEDVFVY